MLAICAIVRNEAAYIAEWITFHRNQGISHFRLYDNGSDDGTSDIIWQHGIEPLILVDHPFNFNSQQIEVYEHAAQSLAGIVPWVAFIDADEFIYSRRGQSLATTLSRLSVEISAIAVQQHIFGSNGHILHQIGGVVERFLRRASDGDPEHDWFKTIARPERVRQFSTVHTVTLWSGSYALSDGSPLSDGGDWGRERRRINAPIGLNHYMLKSLDEFREKQTRWAGRYEAFRVCDDYFFSRDAIANAAECHEALNSLRGLISA